jgi:hypothetical protein
MYKSQMDDWEVSFYIELILNEIGSDSFDILLYAASLRLGINWSIIKELGLLNYTSPITLNSRRDYDFFEYINETDFNISNSLSERLEKRLENHI